MPLPKSLTTVTPFSKALAMGLFILLPFVGFWFGTQYGGTYTAENTISVSPTILLPTPTSAYTHMQRVSDLTWRKYNAADFGISFEYPDNLDHFGNTQSGALQVENGKITLTYNTSYIFQVEKLLTSDNVETWWDKNDSSKHNGNGFMPANMTKTAFHNKTAYYFETRVTQQVPTDYYIVPFDGYFLQLSFSKPTPYRDALWSCINVQPNPCTASDLYKIADYDNHYRQFQQVIVDRILTSVAFQQQ